MGAFCVLWILSLIGIMILGMLCVLSIRDYLTSNEALYYVAFNNNLLKFTIYIPVILSFLLISCILAITLMFFIPTTRKMVNFEGLGLKSYYYKSNTAFLWKWSFKLLIISAISIFIGSKSYFSFSHEGIYHSTILGSAQRYNWNDAEEIIKEISYTTAIAKTGGGRSLHLQYTIVFKDGLKLKLLQDNLKYFYKQYGKISEYLKIMESVATVKYEHTSSGLRLLNRDNVHGGKDFWLKVLGK